ncbi:hypothetical protein [Oceanobacillus manasiensis]|uniref:hypothetical protein n=1 Tax=Oceanobacillus manasiensis TaxID=586413 RepID=UPI0005A87F4D|nr:hypothetical protein [Oceanobacillus manasiensis]
MQSYNKEVTAVIDAGLPADATVQLFQVLTNHFAETDHCPEVYEFRDVLLAKRKYSRRKFHRSIDEVCAHYPLPVKLTWRQVKYEPKRIRRCAVCSDYFYDVSRNGRSATCFNGLCPKYYEQRRKRAGTIIDPVYRRRVDEVLVDFQPGEHDKRGHAVLNEVEMTAVRNKFTEYS